MKIQQNKGNSIWKSGSAVFFNEFLMGFLVSRLYGRDYNKKSKDTDFPITFSRTAGKTTKKT